MSYLLSWGTQLKNQQTLCASHRYVKHSSTLCGLIRLILSSRSPILVRKCDSCSSRCTRIVLSFTTNPVSVINATLIRAHTNKGLTLDLPLSSLQDSLEIPFQDLSACISMGQRDTVTRTQNNTSRTRPQLLPTLPTSGRVWHKSSRNLL